MKWLLKNKPNRKATTRKIATPRETKKWMNYQKTTKRDKTTTDTINARHKEQKHQPQDRNQNNKIFFGAHQNWPFSKGGGTDNATHKTTKTTNKQLQRNLTKKTGRQRTILNESKNWPRYGGASDKPKGSATKATQTAVKTAHRHKRRQQLSVNVKGAVVAAVMAVCVVGNRGGGRAAMLRGCVANVLVGFGGQECTWTIPWQKSAGLWLQFKVWATFCVGTSCHGELWFDFVFWAYTPCLEN